MKISKDGIRSFVAWTSFGLLLAAILSAMFGDPIAGIVFALASFWFREEAKALL